MEKDNQDGRYRQQAAAYLLAIGAAVGIFVAEATAGTFPAGVHEALLLLLVVLVAAYGGIGPGLAATGLGTLGLGLSYLWPPHASGIHRPVEGLSLALVSTACLVVSMLCQQARSATAQARTLASTQGDLLRRERAADERYEELLEGLDAVVWEADGDLQLLRVSRRVLPVLGYSVVECMTAEAFWSGVLPEKTLVEFRERCARVLRSGEAEEWEHPLRAADGRRLWVHSRIGVSRRDGDGPLLLRGSLTDVTELHATEETLRRSEDWYRRIVDTAFEGIWLLDASGRTVFLNDRMAQMLGAPVEAVVGKPWAEFTCEEDRLHANRYFHQVRRGRKLQQDFRLQRPDGTVLWGLASASAVRLDSGEFAGVLAMVTEVTDRKRAENALRFLAEASSVLTSSLDYVATLEHVARLAISALAEWCVVDVIGGDAPPRRLAVAHVDRSVEARLRRISEAQPLDLERPLPIGEALRTGKTVVAHDVPDPDGAGKSRRGSRGSGAALVVPLTARGRTLGTISFVRPGRYADEEVVLAEDLARRAAIALDNARLYREVQRADRAKEEFLAMLAHELRNPLAPVRNTIRLLRERPDDPATVWRVQDVVERQVRHLTRLTDDLLDVSRITRGKIELRRECLDLARIAREVAEDHRDTVQRAGITCTCLLPEGPVWVDGDATRLAQVIGNLLLNGCKFTDAGGSVTLRLEVDSGAGRAWVRVRDTGIGIPPDVLPHVFEAFIQADGTLDRSRGGLGLGLAVVKGLVELHGGHVRVESILGQGAELAFSLPVVAPPPQPAGTRVPGDTAWPVLLPGEAAPYNAPDDDRRALPSAAPGPRRGGLSILIVEDNLDAAETLRDLLEEFGHRVAVAHTGLAGVDAAYRCSPDVVLCDIGLPGLDGYGVASALRSNPDTAGIRLIAVSGYGREEDRRRSLEAGFDLHLTKPVDPSVLEEHLTPSAAPA